MDFDFVASNLNRSVTLISSNLAIFTFVLIFLFGISGVHYFEVVANSKTSVATKMLLKRRGDTLFVLSLLVGTGEPALILFTLGLTIVAVIATVLWTLYAGLLVQKGRRMRT